MFKRLGKVGVAVLVLVSFGLGMFFQDVVLAKWSCVHTQVRIQTLVIDQDPFTGSPSSLIAIGEQVLCAKDWRVTNIYGPWLPEEYKYQKWTPKLEWIPFYKYLGTGEGEEA